MAGVKASALTKVLNDNRDAFAILIGRYFSEDYTGSHFEFFESRGDNQKTKNRFTYADVYAPSLLDVPVEGELGYGLVEGNLAKKAAVLLSKIPVGRELHTFSTNPLARFPTDLYNLIDAGPATTSKLLARKRPHLLPILDSVLKKALVQGDKGRWNHYFQLFSDANLVKALEKIKKKAVSLQPNFPNIAQLSLLRVLDIALWMEHREGVHGKKGIKEQHPENCLLTYLGQSSIKPKGN